MAGQWNVAAGHLTRPNENANNDSHELSRTRGGPPYSTSGRASANKHLQQDI